MLPARDAPWPLGETVEIGAAGWLGAFGPPARESGLSLLARLEGRDGPLGYAALANPSAKGAFLAFDRELVSASLGIVSTAIENQRLVGTLNRGRAQLEAANRRMEDLDRLRTEMLQNLNHEFRTPVAVILGAASCMRDLAPGGQATHFLDMIESHASQVRDVVSLLLDHADLLSVHASIPCTPTDVTACVRAAVSARAGNLKTANRDVHVTADAEPLVAADALRLRRVLDELLANALKFSWPGTPVTVSVGCDPEGGVVVEVQDQGRGMTAEELAVAFEPFRQGDGSSTRRAGGLGIGLTACRRVAELMGGSLDLESAAGRGTTARLRLRSV
jgi:signal transduction histidine kinase